ncbi:hypothetical protein WM03_21085 [Burkholderia ubonensis]|uniref:hypothetical protein n=1 Tax=Burkholderia ubonensis TaxID=101571 RepID=UPI00075E549A|nr:hypothetical protein [Burkholderia ubonensis]KVN70901.1 hypothetical protein WJ65_06510 [Burkholderia ubonensis]KWI17402.1 hypothetical protein WM02_07860 [Burkholderia ubonensis]KWI24452.1 hypothetical protein WM03_21085 [Burkholderia ubonensis]ODQ36403.1 hypothetical protein BGV63_17650 [Burkholderia ubonensis]OJA29519.1 hypothetical protein BGV58_12680 [Burkholderia ubonensis]
MKKPAKHWLSRIFCMFRCGVRFPRIIPTEDDQFVPLDTPLTADGFYFPLMRIPHLGEYRTYTALAITHMIADSLNQFHRIHLYIVGPEQFVSARG